MRIIRGVLIVLHIGLLLWGGLGLVEYLRPGAGFGLQNPLFPPGVQLAHWLAILSGGAAYLSGALVRPGWHLWLLAPAYAFMAAVCAVETVHHLVSPWRWAAMAAEYAAYLAILAFLWAFPAAPPRPAVDRLP